MASVLIERMLALLEEASIDLDKIPETPAARKTRLFLEAQGRKRGRAEGKAKGRIEGEVKAKKDAILALLKARGLSVSTEQRAILRGCTDLAKINRWIIRVATASSASDVLGPTTPSETPRAPKRRSGGARTQATRRT